MNNTENKIVRKNFENERVLDRIRFGNNFVDDFLFEGQQMADIPINALRVIFNIINIISNEQFRPEDRPRQLSLFDEEFDSIQSVDPQRNTIPVNVVKEGGIISGGEVPAWNEAEFATVHKKYRVITRAFADLCNPEAGYEPETAQNSIELKKGEYHDYHIYLNATRYTVEPGHSLALVITTEDPINCLIHKTYSVEIENASVTAEVPMTAAVENRVMTRK